MPAPVGGGRITQDYGVPGSYAAGYHTGRDWAGGDGRIYATRAGKVTKAQYDGDYGNRVEILTEGIEHSYSHMSSFAVTNGQQVEQGQYLGLMGSTGNSTGPHCHYEERHAPYGYSDDRDPQFDTSDSDSTEEALMAGHLATFFNWKGSVYEADLAAGTYWRIKDSGTLNDRKSMLTRAGVPWFDWDPGKDVKNPDAFGRLLP